MADQVVSVRQFACQPRVTMWVWLSNLEFDLMMDFSVAINFNDPSGTGFGNHDVAIGQGLKRVCLDTLSLVAILLGAVIRPNDLFCFGVDFNNLAIAFLHHDVATGENMDIVDSAPFHFPLNLAGLVDQGQLVVALDHDTVPGVNRIQQS